MCSVYKTLISYYIEKLINARTLQNICVLALFFLTFCSGIFATECITPESHARRYFGADLVIFGEVVSCTTRVVSIEDVPGDSGWTYHRVLSVDEATVRVDSVLKGSFGDSAILVQTESSQESRWRLDKVTETGDSLPIGQLVQMAVLPPGPGDASEIPSSGSWILFLTEKDGAFEFMWRADHNKSNLDLYRIFEDEGEDIFEKYDLSGWEGVKKDSVWELRLRRKPFPE